MRDTEPLEAFAKVRAKQASKDGNMHGLAAILRGPRKSAGTSGWTQLRPSRGWRSLSGAVGAKGAGMGRRGWRGMAFLW